MMSGMWMYESNKKMRRARWRLVSSAASEQIALEEVVQAPYEPNEGQAERRVQNDGKVGVLPRNQLLFVDLLVGARQPVNILDGNGEGSV